MKKILKGSIPSELFQSSVFIYGGGNTGVSVLKILKSYSVHIEYIIDDDLNKWGKKVEGVEIISYQQFVEKCKYIKDIAVVMGTIYGRSILRRFSETTSDVDVYEIYNWLVEEYGLKNFIAGVNDKNEIEQFRNESCKVKAFLADDESKKVLDGVYNYLVSNELDFISNICTEQKQYFIPEVLAAIKQPLNIVDGGAYVGELYRTIEENNINLEHWYCFETDTENYEKLLKNAKKMGLSEVQQCIKKGLWDKESVLYFDGDKDTASRVVSYPTDRKIETISLDIYFKDKNCNFIKMDIEGAEYPALCGGIETIKRDRPILAISIYHSLKDYYRIPKYLRSELQGYTYYIRHHSLILCETVLYAIPNELTDNICSEE